MALSSPAVAAAATSPLWGLWARPADRPGQVALALAGLLVVVAIVPRGPRWLAGVLDFTGVGDLPRPRRFLAIAAFGAAFLSLAYVAIYLRGGPRAAEAAGYWLQGRALAHGRLAWSAASPTASFRATPLLFAWPDRLAGTGAPGLPMLLAPAFLVGAPMLAGPLLAAAMVVATWLLAREIVLQMPARTTLDAETAGRLAAGFSVVCAALRYDTSDLVPDGLAALATAVAVLGALRAARLGGVRSFGWAGLGVAAALAAAPASCIAPAAGVLGVALRGRAPDCWRRAAWAAAGVLPGLLLLLVFNRVATGAALRSPWAAYRSALASLAAHPGARDAATATLRAARAHLADVTNLEPLALVAVVPLVGATRSRAAHIVAMTIAIHLVVGLASVARSGPPDHPALGAALPLEHALLGAAVVAVLPGPRAVLGAIGAMALALAGFAVHTSHDHAARARSDSGRPHFEPDVAREANVTHGLLFFDDDQGYELASDPGVAASHGVEAVRARGDDHDRLLYDLLGHPPAHRYVVGAASASAKVWTPSNGGSDTWRFEAEADWPPALVEAGRAAVVEGAGMCASDAKALALEPVGTGEATMAIELPLPRGSAPAGRRTWGIIPRVFVRGGAGEATMVLAERPGGVALARWTWKDGANGPGCIDLAEQTLAVGPETHGTWLFVTARGGAVALDRTTLRPR